MPQSFVIFIETLTGTEFEVRVSPNETILSLKARIQRAEGIPISQQHLIYNEKELTNEAKIKDSNMCEGSTLKLVLAMRGGPVNMRKVQIADDQAMVDMKNFLESNRDDLWHQLPSGLQVTLLIFREGDQVNFYRVAETEGTYSPLQESWRSGSSLRNLFGEEDDEWQERMKENEDMQNKMKSLQLEMGKKAKKKGKRSGRPTSSKRKKQTPNEEMKLPALDDLMASIGSNQPTGRSVDLPSHRRLSLDSVSLGKPSSSSTLPGTYRSSSTDNESPIVHPGKASKNPLQQPKKRNRNIPKPSPLEESVITNSSKKNTKRRGRKRSKGNLSNSREATVPFPPIFPSGRHSRLAEPPTSLERWHSYNTPLGFRSNSIEEVEEEEDNSRNSVYSFPEHARGNGNRQAKRTNAKEMNPLSELPGRPRVPKVTRTRRDKKQKDIPQISENIAKKEIEINNILDRRTLNMLGSSSRPKTSPATAYPQTEWEPPMSPALSTRSERSYQYASDRKGRQLCKILKPIGEGPPAMTRNLKRDGRRHESIEARVARDFLMEMFADEEIRNRGITRSTFRKGLGRMVVTANKESREQIRNAMGGTMSSSKGRKSPSYKVGRNSPGFKNSLPPVSPKKPRKPKCAQCGKKLGLATTFSCHCGKVFCGQDRYAEAHNCTYDYKHEGRKLLEQANPVVTAQKLPKI